MRILRLGWSPVLITALAVAGYMYEWPLEIIAPALIVVLVIGLTVVATGGRERELERVSFRLKDLAGYFGRRFAGNSSLSIFAIIDGLFGVDDAKVWDWARACEASRRVFDSWCNSFMGRVGSDVKTRRYTIYLHTYLHELWLLNSHYYEFVEQFYEVAGKIEVPKDIIDQYNKFVVEYNAFVQNFQTQIGELKRVAGTEIEPPSVKLAKELSAAKPAPVEQKPAERISRPTENKGYIM
ncbi:hypothetical protein ACFLYF_01755 [Chloroflexota bacterium]